MTHDEIAARAAALRADIVAGAREIDAAEQRMMAEAGGTLAPAYRATLAQQRATVAARLRRCADVEALIATLPR